MPIKQIKMSLTKAKLGGKNSKYQAGGGRGSGGCGGSGGGGGGGGGGVCVCVGGGGGQINSKTFLR